MLATHAVAMENFKQEKCHSFRRAYLFPPQQKEAEKNGTVVPVIYTAVPGAKLTSAARQKGFEAG